MPPTTMTLRDRLRRDTRVAHDAVDHVFGQLDLARPEGLAAFLRGQHAGLSALAAAEGAATEVDAALADIETDLTALGTAPLRPAAPPEPDHATARAYIWQGSRVGARMLAKRWQGARDPAVRAAGRYMSRPAVPEAWQDFCAQAAARPAEGPEADRTVAAALAWFAVFERCARDAAGPLDG